LTTEH